MRISKKQAITDHQLFSPHELFSNLTQMTKGLSIYPNKGTQEKSILKKTKFLDHVDEVLHKSNQKNNDAIKKPKKEHGLKKIIKEQKIKSIIRNFSTKILRNNVNSNPTTFEPFKDQQRSWLENDGFRLPDYIDNLWSLVSFIQIMCLIVIYTLSLVFKVVMDSPYVSYFQSFSIIFYSFEIVANLTTVKFADGRKLVRLKQISNHYLKNRFGIDVISIIILIVDVSVKSDIMGIIRLFIILKLGQSFSKFQKLQNAFIDNFYQQQYWGLIKVFFTNFAFSHILAIVLIGISFINQQNNWIVKNGWSNAPWYETYTWAYYWGTTIMLTVGFGDIAATNYKQALCLVLIQTISCLALAYNINCVGNLISNIRSQDIEKNRNYRVFNKLTEKNDIPDDLSWRINNYIQQSTNIKKKFNFEQQNGFISKLPQGLKADFLKESNKKIFQNLIFFKNLTEKSLLNLAEKIQMRITHPQEIIRRKQDDFCLLILQQGHVGLSCKKTGCDFNDTIIDQIKINQKQRPFLLSLDFISKNKPIYQMKSLQYSILYWLNYQSTINILQNAQLDYHHYCQLRDKSRHIINEYEVFTCDACNKNHTKFTCPKLHYIPIQQHVIFRYLHSVKKKFLNRVPYDRKLKNHATLRKYHNKVDKQIQLQIASKKRRIGKIYQEEKRSSIRVAGQQEEYHQKSKKKMLELSNICKNTAINIQQEVIKIMVSHNRQPSFWDVQSDEIKNFKFYFTSQNASSLKSLYPGL